MSIEGFNGEENYYPHPTSNKHKGDVMERRDRTATNDYSRLLDKVMYADSTQARIDARLQAAREHTALVEQRDLLAQALRDVRAKFFEHAQSGANVVKGKLVPLDNEQHPWVPGAEAPSAIQIIDDALATVEQGGEA